jgi:hypothetical protein
VLVVDDSSTSLTVHLLFCLELFWICNDCLRVETAEDLDYTEVIICNGKVEIQNVKFIL